MTRGPRRVGILALKAKILKAQDKPRGDVLQQELDVLRALPRPQRRPSLEKQVESELAAAGTRAAR
jgi:hypothetical protein